MRHIAVVALLIASTGLNAAEIPQQFRGYFNGNVSAPGSCTRQSVESHEDDGILIVSAKTIEWWASTCEIEGLEKTTDPAQTATINMKCGGEGERWKSKIGLALFVIRGRTYLLVSVRNSNQSAASLLPYERCL